MIYLFTFCVFISRHSKKDLLYSLELLIKSLENTNKYKLIVFSNFEILLNNSNVDFLNYFDTEQTHDFGGTWLNLSFNKIYLYKYLYKKYGIDFIWIDLDTIITYNLEYLNTIDNIFVECGGNYSRKKNLFEKNNTFLLETNRSIQGNFWKLNIHLCNNILSTFQEVKKNNLRLCYDLQDLFSYHIYFKINMKDINVFGLNFKQNVLTGLSIWTDLENYQHPNLRGLNNLYRDKNNILRTKFDVNKEIHIVSFTFFTLNMLKDKPQFNKVFFPKISNIQINQNNQFFETFLNKFDNLIFFIKTIKL